MRGIPVILASSNSHSAIKRPSTLGEYLDTGLTEVTGDSLANDTFYLFGDTQTAEWLELQGGYVAPSMVRDDHPISCLGLGGRHSGVAFHTHGPAWAESIHGTKRWFLTPPRDTPPFQPDVTSFVWQRDVLPRMGPRRALSAIVREHAGGHADSLDTLDTQAVLREIGVINNQQTVDGEASPNGVLEAAVSSSGVVQAAAAIGRPWTCDVPAGHIIYIPPGWWHATLNLGAYNAFVSTFTMEHLD